jgi:hypothetical protein
MRKEYEEYERLANESWDLSEFGLPKSTKISFQDFPNNLRLVHEVRKDLVIEGFREIVLNDDKALYESFSPDAQWELGVWSITDEVWLEDTCQFKDIGESFKEMILFAEKLSPKKVAAADKAYLRIGERPVYKFDVENHMPKKGRKETK